MFKKRKITFLDNINIGKKLLISFIIVTVISSISGIVGVFFMTELNNRYSEGFTNYGFSQGDIGLFSMHFNNSRVILKDIIYQTDSNEKHKSYNQLVESNKKMNQYFKKMKSEMVSDSEVTIYNKIRTEMKKYTDYSDNVTQLAISHRSDDAFSMMRDKTDPLSEEILNSINELITEKTTTGGSISNTLKRRSNVAIISIILVILITILFSLLIAFLISRSISKPVKEMAGAAQNMAKGNLEVKVSANSNDEIGKLANAFSESTSIIKTYIKDISRILGELENGNLDISTDLTYIGDYEQLKNSLYGIKESLNSTLGAINNAANNVSNGSKQLSDEAQSLAEGAYNQNSSVENLVNATAKLLDHTQSNSQNADVANDNVNNVRSRIEICNGNMDNLVAAMGKIDSSSNKVSQIIKTIQNIAFQTNILSLNASVEAARAGEAGKGFAVVADEVRKLANKSASAAKSTAEMIGVSLDNIKNGNILVRETADSLLNVVNSAESVNESVNQILSSSKQQISEITQVKKEVEQISDVVRQNSATAEESAAASKALSEQSQNLKDLVHKFKLTEN